MWKRLYLMVELAFISGLLNLTFTQSLIIADCKDDVCLAKGVTKNRVEVNSLKRNYNGVNSSEVHNRSDPIDSYDAVNSSDPGNLSVAPVEYIVSDKYPYIVLPIDRNGRFDILNPAVDPRGLPFVEGDILYDPDDEETPEELDRKFLPSIRYLWPNDPYTGLPTVPFRISPSVESVRTTIFEAIALWENSTCINFHELSKPMNSCHVTFVEDSGCWSYVGRQYKREGPQTISIGLGCRRVGTIAHEIGHALGMLHEQSRSDRDDHVMVIWDNIGLSKWRNFKKRPSENENVPYDTSSIMHYGSFFFSTTGEITLMTKNPFHQWLLGQRERLTYRDVQIVNIMYGCTARWVEDCKNTSLICENGGYVDASCKCLCPPGTKGNKCQTISGSYYPDLKCGGNVTEPLNISSPNYPKPFPTETWCMWWAQAGECQKVRFIVHDFELLYRSHNRCFWDSLEIRDEDPFKPGNVYCENEIEKEQEFHSKNGSLFVSFYGKYEYSKGFTATIDFVDDLSCVSASLNETSASGKI